MPAGRPEEYLNPNSPYFNPNDPAAQGMAGGQPVPPAQDMAGGQPAPPEAPTQGAEALIGPIQEMSQTIVQMAGPEALAQILQQGLEMLMQEQQPAQQPAQPQLPSAAPVPGGEGFGPSFG